MRVRKDRVGQLRRVAHKAWNDCEQRSVYRLERHTVLRSCEPVGVVKALQDTVWRAGAGGLDARRIWIAIGSDGIAVFAHAHDVGESKVGTKLEVFIIKTGFETGHQ